MRTQLHGVLDDRTAGRARDHRGGVGADHAHVRQGRVDDGIAQRRAPACVGLRLARSEALTQRRETFLVLDVAGRRFKVDQDPQAIPAAERRRAETLHCAEGPGRREGRIDPLFSRRRQQRRPDHASAAGERKFEVDVDWLTGRVAILD